MTSWDPVRLRAAASELRWSNGRTTMRRFSTDCRRRSGFVTLVVVLANARREYMERRCL